MHPITTILCATALGAVTSISTAQTPRQYWQGLHATWAGHPKARMTHAIQVPVGAKVFTDLHYGPGNLQTFDVYVPADAQAAPVIFMVHGGGWRRGDKASQGVVQNKVAHWLPLGFIVVSVNYPLVPDVTPAEEATQIIMALAKAQRLAPDWGGDPADFVLMGHSAGANLVSQVAAQPKRAIALGALPWLATVALDSAAYNVVSIMQAPHLSLYDTAFGDDYALWVAASPSLQVKQKIAPFLAVCSSRRADSCAQARAFADKARQYGSHISILPEDLSHGEIDADLGLPSSYTDAVDDFLTGLSPGTMVRLVSMTL